MKAVKGNLFAVEIKGKLNTTNRSRDQWAQIVDCRSGRVLHTGQPRYIKRVAKAKYNTLLDIQSQDGRIGVVLRTAMYTQALNSGGGVAQRLNYPLSFLIQIYAGWVAPNRQDGG